MEFEIYIPTKVLFGKNKLSELHKEKMPGQKALIVTSKGQSIKRYGYLDRLVNELQLCQVDYVIYNQIGANPTSDEIDNGVIFAKEHHIDFIVAIGGGSVIDSAKMIALVMNNGGKIWDYACPSGEKRKAEHDPAPIIVISTTAGTGSEIDCAGAFTYVPTSEKVAFKDERLFPRITVIDPSLTYSIPQHLTAYQGWDALTHSMENLINKNQHEMSSIFAKQAIQYAGKFLPLAVKDGSNEEAREKMAFVSYLSGMVIQTSGTTSMHALECAMSALHPELPHGAGLIILSKAYFQFFIDKHVCDDIFIEMAQLLGIKNASQPSAFIEAIKDIHQQCEVNHLKMSDYHITMDEFPIIIANARKAMGANFHNDRYELSDEDCLAILKQSY